MNNPTLQSKFRYSKIVNNNKPYQRYLAAEETHPHKPVLIGKLRDGQTLYHISSFDDQTKPPFTHKEDEDEVIKEVKRKLSFLNGKLNTPERRQRNKENKKLKQHKENLEQQHQELKQLLDILQQNTPPNTGQIKAEVNNIKEIVNTINKRYAVEPNSTQSEIRATTNEMLDNKPDIDKNLQKTIKNIDAQIIETLTLIKNLIDKNNRLNKNENIDIQVEIANLIQEKDECVNKKRQQDRVFKHCNKIDSCANDYCKSKNINSIERIEAKSNQYIKSELNYSNIRQQCDDVLIMQQNGQTYVILIELKNGASLPNCKMYNQLNATQHRFRIQELAENQFSGELTDIDFNQAIYIGILCVSSNPLAEKINNQDDNGADDNENTNSNQFTTRRMGLSPRPDQISNNFGKTFELHGIINDPQNPSSYLANCRSGNIVVTTVQRLQIEKYLNNPMYILDPAPLNETQPA